VGACLGIGVSFCLGVHAAVHGGSQADQKISGKIYGRYSPAGGGLLGAGVGAGVVVCARIGVGAHVCARAGTRARDPVGVRLGIAVSFCLGVHAAVHGGSQAGSGVGVGAFAGCQAP